MEGARGRGGRSLLRDRTGYRRRKRQRLEGNKLDTAWNSESEQSELNSESSYNESTNNSGSSDDVQNCNIDIIDREHNMAQLAEHNPGDLHGDEEGEEEESEEEEEEENEQGGHNQDGGNSDHISAQSLSESESDNSEAYFSDIDESADEESGQSSVDSESEPESEPSDHEEEASGDENQEDDNIGDQPIYPGARLTLHESLLAIFTLLSVENLSGKLVSSILQLIALHCPDGSIVKKTLHTFRKYFSKIGKSLIIFHYFCSDCIFPLKTKTSQCQKCKKKDNVSYFLELPLFIQLQNMYNRANFFQDLQFRFRADRKLNVENIEDIFDGEIYKDQMRDGFLSNNNNLSFMWYTDGVSIFKSSSFSIWPLCLVINELPYKMRTLPSNILLVGLWFGKAKPSPNVFLRPLYKTMKKFERNGHTFVLPDATRINVKAKVICGTCDLPAKSKFLQFKQFNSYFGCPKCLIEGGRADTGKTTVQVYPYSPIVEKRMHQESIEHARQALEARKKDREASVCGVKGPTLLSKIVPDLIKCTAIDVMHGVFLGICKMLIHLWFSSTFSNMPWSVCHLNDVVNEKLRKIKAPSCVQRAPRSLKDVKFWKASEYKLFLLYYSVAVLKNVLDDVYFKHHLLLVSAISLLSQDSISLSQIQAASALLASYVSDFARLYPLRYLGLNVHQLIHLGDSVLELGPLWVYSCFFLENFNGTINKYFHGTQHVALQICSSVAMFMKMPRLRSDLPPESLVTKFCLAIENQSKSFKIADQIDHCTYAVGTYCKNRLRHSVNIIRESLNLINGSCSVFYRLKRKGVMYCGEEYGRKSIRKESSFIMFQDGNFNKLGRILRFVRWSNCRNLCDVDCRNCPAQFFAIVRIYKRQLWFVHEMRNIRMSYMSNVVSTEEIIAVDVHSILALCFFIEANGEQYMAVPVNRLELE